MKNKNKSNLPNKGNNKDFLRSNVETGAHNWNWQPNYNNSRMNENNLDAYRKNQLKNAKKVGGGILNTNVETGNWYGMQFMVPEKSDRIGPNDLEAQEKFFAGQLKETITGPLPGERSQNTPVRYNSNANYGQRMNFNQNYNNNDDRYQFIEKNGNYNNNNYYNEDYNNIKYSQNYYKNFDEKNDIKINKTNNLEEPDFEKLMEAGPGVLKVEATEKIITENGVKKKLTRIKKYMENGDTKEEIYKTNP